MHVRGSADGLVVAAESRPPHPDARCFAWQLGTAGVEPVSGVLGCCELQGEFGVMCRVSLL